MVILWVQEESRHEWKRNDDLIWDLGIRLLWGLQWEMTWGQLYRRAWSSGDHLGKGPKGVRRREVQEKGQALEEKSKWKE